MMSFAKVNRFSRSSGRRPTQSRKVNAPKQDWVSTVHDLNVHKATPEELKRRHDLHKSQNRVAAQQEMKERILRQKLRKSISPAQLDPAHLNIIREVLSDQFQLQDVLSRSDRSLAVVKDLFGDAPRRQTGFPNLTVAPGSGPDPHLPVLLRPDLTTPLSLLSQSVMDSQALNEFQDVGAREYSEEEPDPPSSITHSRSVDMSRCRQLLQKEGPGAKREPSRPTSPQPPCAPEEQAALNATGAVRCVWSRQSQSGGQPLSTQVDQAAPATSGSARKSGSSNNSKQSCGEPLGHDSLTENRSSLNLLQCMLGEVEAELDSLELQEPFGSVTTKHSPLNLTSFSVSFLRTVTRLARCLRQSREELQREVQDRTKLVDEVMEQRRLIDALTAETLTLREESLAIQLQCSQADHFKHHCVLLEPLEDFTATESCDGDGDVGGGGDDHDGGAISKGPVQHCVWDTEQGLRVGACTNSTAPYCVESGAETHYGDGNTQEQILPPPAHRDHLSPALLLSPPHQRNSPHPHSHHSTEQGMSLQWHAVHSQEHVCIDQLQVPPQASILQQIAELTQQNGLIRAQLFCTQSAGSQDPGPHRPPNRAAQLHEKALPAGPCMEQRLLELNRQSTEARGRLLELIEQQTQTSVSAVSPSVSPSISPIPSNMRTLLTTSADGERSTTQCLSHTFSPLPAAVGAGGHVQG
ncbi:hypothetical protein COCON_G00064120 [Conger conger]|uniref:Spindle and centriole-associated protein 1 n=1 Tax=Conger conger TaxID=82655 RepID=A0A9Q1DS07_CONCO|nr:spindle and centriole-associated protein 1 isoform X2 [Conger conger]KAJ8279346.1 hypothetical protein COCON_G00064120 [Conger conger]